MDVNALDLNLLRYLQVLVEEESVSRAADRLGMSQPGLSTALGRLRLLMNDQLLVRTPKGMIPTPCALAMLETFRDFKQQFESVVVTKSEFDPMTDRRSFAVECFDYTLAAYMAPVFAHITGQGFACRLVCQQMADANFRQRLEAGRADLIIGFVPKLADTLKISKIKSVEFACIARTGHPLCDGAIEAADYLRAEHIGLCFGGEGLPTYLEQHLVDLFIAHGEQRRTTLNLPSLLAAGHFVAETNLLATVPIKLAREMAATLPLQILPLPVPVTLDFAMAWHLRADEDPGHRWFRNTLRSVCAAVPD